MSELTEDNVDLIQNNCAENLAGIGESLSLCLDGRFRVACGQSQLWVQAAGSTEFDGPGLTIAFQLGQAGILCLIPQKILPEWYQTPNKSQRSRLETLAMEWSLTLLPPELEPTRYSSVTVQHLRDEVIGARPSSWATMLPLLVYDADTTDDQLATTRPLARIGVVWPLINPPFPLVEDSEQGDFPVLMPSGVKPLRPAETALAPPPRPTPRMDRLRNLPVCVSVRLAERKIELGQMLSITPGALLTFNKSCEDLLDLYVNNTLFCRGEAVKIGEKFGLKVNAVGIKPVREVRIID